VSLNSRRKSSKEERAALEERPAFECRLAKVLGGHVFKAHRLLYHSSLGGRREQAALEERPAFECRLAKVLLIKWQ